jgi:hypothetical protein
VPRPGAAASEEAIKEFALKNAAPYVHPKRVWLLSEMPLAGTNKINRRALAAGGQISRSKRRAEPSSAAGFSMDREFRMRWLREAQCSHGKKVRFATDSPLEGTGFELSVPREIGFVSN